MRFSTIASIVALAWTNSAAAEEPDVNDKSATAASCVMENGQVFVLEGDEKTPIELPGPAVAILQQGHKLFVAMGRQGAIVFDISNPKNIGRLNVLAAEGEEVTGFAIVDGEVWVRTVATKIVPMAQEPTAFASVPEAKTAITADGAETKRRDRPAALDRPIRIIEVAPGEVTLDTGSKDGVQVGDRLSVFKSVSIKGAGKERFAGSELAAVLEVVAVNEDRCLASIGRGDRVTVHDSVRPHLKDHPSSKMYPRRLADLGEVDVTLRPILNVRGRIGFGALNDISLSYWGKGYFVGVFIQPLGFAITDLGNALVMNLSAEAGYDSRAFAIGLGAGMSSITFSKNALSITQSVRLGARDGVNLVTRNAFSLRKKNDFDDWYDGTSEPAYGFEWGGLSSRFTIPLTARTALFFGGGGSENYYFGEGGVHAWLVGHGDAGSLGLSVAAGAAGVTADDYSDDYYTSGDMTRITAFGPMMALGFNYRFGFNRSKPESGK